MITLKNLSKSFGIIEAVKDISFDVDKGEFVFLTGPSGAGKTTLLRLILREITADNGEIIFDGVDMISLPNKDIPKVRQKIGVVFQDYKVLPERTVSENVQVALAVVGVEQSEWKSRIDRVLELVGLSKRSELFPSQLSGGELQRVSLARALVVNPKLILADEPTGNLDWDTSSQIINLFEKINQEGKTIIVATHNKMIIDKFKKRKIELVEGHLKNSDNVNKQEEEDKKDHKKEDKEEDKKEEKDTEIKIPKVKIKVEEE